MNDEFEHDEEVEKDWIDLVKKSWPYVLSVIVIAIGSLFLLLI